MGLFIEAMRDRCRNYGGHSASLSSLPLAFCLGTIAELSMQQRNVSCKTSTLWHFVCCRKPSRRSADAYDVLRRICSLAVIHCRDSYEHHDCANDDNDAEDGNGVPNIFRACDSTGKPGIENVIILFESSMLGHRHAI